jgi:hypothetical protein
MNLRWRKESRTMSEIPLPIKDYVAIGSAREQARHRR